MKFLRIIFFCTTLLSVTAAHAQKYGNDSIQKVIASYTEQTNDNAARYQSLSLRWSNNDTTLTSDDVFFLRCFFTNTSRYNPILLDTLSSRAFRHNEKEQYEKALSLCDSIKTICPYNLASYKESAFALSKLNKDQTTDWKTAVKIANSMLYFGNSHKNKQKAGDYDNPFFTLNQIEGAICYDMCFGATPEKMGIAKYKSGILLSAYTQSHTATRWAYFNHAQQYYPRFLDFTGQKITIEYPDSSIMVTDIDGNTYHCITIGKTIWMAENLRTTRFNDGIPLQKMVRFDWIFEQKATAAYGWFKDDSLACNEKKYGVLYNWHTVNARKDGKNICPKNWHVPSTKEWETMLKTLEPSYNSTATSNSVGKKLKHTKTWYYNGNGTNESGFTALPAGYALSIEVPESGCINNVTNGYWWTSSATDKESSQCYSLSYEDDQIHFYTSFLNDGLSIRCIKDK